MSANNKLVFIGTATDDHSLKNNLDILKKRQLHPAHF
jgi:hypothetical protein